MNKDGVIKRYQQEINNGLLSVLVAFDQYTHDHSRNVAHYALLLAQELEISKDQIQSMYLGGLLHDLGKIGIASQILKKDGPLTESEHTAVQKHPEIGAGIAAQFSDLAHIIPIILHHHEHFDGNGYPNRLRADQIPLGARLVAVVDAYDAITTTRCYRKAQGSAEALQELRKYSGTQFDPEMINAFVRVAKNL